MMIVLNVDEDVHVQLYVLINALMFIHVGTLVRQKFIAVPYSERVGFNPNTINFVILCHYRMAMVRTFHRQLYIS